MATEEVKYTIPGDGTNGGRIVDIKLTYDSSAPNANGSYTVTDATGTYVTTDNNGNTINTDTITGIVPVQTFGQNDNELFIVSNPATTPIVDKDGITFSINNVADSNKGSGYVNFFDNVGVRTPTSPPTNTPQYREDGANISSPTSISETAVCYVAGTMIRRVDGDAAVEDLSIGDFVVTASGKARPIRWLGHHTVDCRARPRLHAAMPIRIAAHAFGPDLPARDLYLSPGHPVLVGADADGNGGHLVPIMCLVNGTTIERFAVDEVTYWHVELDEHDILLAEGLAAESYIDLGSRAWFAGADGPLYDPDMALPGMPGRCRPVAIDGPVVEAERRRLDAVFEMRLATACAWPDEASVAGR